METIDIATVIAARITARPEQVRAAVQLLDEGASVPFVARYRKEVTGGLNDTQLRDLASDLERLRRLEAKRVETLEAIAATGRLTDDLSVAIARAETIAELDGIHAPYRSRRQSASDKAIEAGLEPLLDRILVERGASPVDLAEAFVAGTGTNARDALSGARDILIERLVRDPDLSSAVRAYARSHATLVSKKQEGANPKADRDYSAFYDHAEPIGRMTSHRIMAILRAWREEVVDVQISVDHGDEARVTPVMEILIDSLGVGRVRSTPFEDWIVDVARWAWRVRFLTRISTEIIADLRERAEKDAIAVFARNLRDVLLAAPAGPKVIMGLDPAMHSGIKVCVVGRTGEVLDTTTVYPLRSSREAARTLSQLLGKHRVEIVSIGNGTGEGEANDFMDGILSAMPEPRPIKVTVSETGASVYSASELAAREMPHLDVTLRGAVSIARRLQDPLAELVKVDPKALGVGMYQHDIPEHLLSQALDGVVEDAVSSVGVDLNVASPSLLRRIPGLGPSQAEEIVRHRDRNGPFRSRRDLLTVAGIGPRSFEQCAGFLRIRDGGEPLDATSVHPESYGLARRMVDRTGHEVRDLIGNRDRIRKIRPAEFVDVEAGVGLPTILDIMTELEKPARDPRPTFVTARLSADVRQIKDLRPEMWLQGTVRNLVEFGAYVDVGVHKDGLLHVSEIGPGRVRDVSTVLKVGDVLDVRVVSIDPSGKRFSLSTRKESSQAGTQGHPADDRARPRGRDDRRTSPSVGSFGDALAAAMASRIR